MKNSCPQWDSNPGPSTYEANSLGVALLIEISIEHLNVDRVYLSLQSKLSVPRGRCSIMICRVFLSGNISIVLLFD